MPTPLAVDLELAKAQVEAKIAAEGAAIPSTGTFVSYSGSPFELFQPYLPAGDQPTAINELVDGINDGEVFQTLLGVTGSGKTFTMANVIAMNVKKLKKLKNAKKTRKKTRKKRYMKIVQM